MLLKLLVWRAKQNIADFHDAIKTKTIARCTVAMEL